MSEHLTELKALTLTSEHHRLTLASSFPVSPTDCWRKERCCSTPVPGVTV